MVFESVVARRFLSILIILTLCSGSASPYASAAPQTRKKHTASRKSATRASKLQHIHRAFVASADLKPMAQQLLQFRSAQAYAGVEAYANKHAGDAAGPLAWLVVGYAHYLDKEYPKALVALQKTNELAPVLGDYLDYLRAAAYHGEENHSAVIKTLDGFEQKYPDSLFIHDSTLLYAETLMSTGAPEKAAGYLEKHRQPVHADVELALARAYRAAGQNARAAEILRKLYFEEPLTSEADAAAIELRAMGEVSPVGNFELRHVRIATLMKARRYSEAASELSPLVEQAPPPELASLQLDFAIALYRERKREDAQ